MAETVKAVVKNKRDTAANLTSDDLTFLNGETIYESDTGLSKTGDGTTSWVNLAYNQRGLPETFDIVSSNTVKALPPITGKIQQFRYYWKNGDGSNTFSMTVSDAATVGGIAATLWIGEGNGYIDIESDGVSDWKVIYYDDSIVNGAEKYIKKADGELEFYTWAAIVGNDTNTITDTITLTRFVSLKNIQNSSNGAKTSNPSDIIDLDLLISNVEIMAISTLTLASIQLFRTTGTFGSSAYYGYSIELLGTWR